MSKHTPFPWTMVVATGSKSGKYIGNYEIAEAIDGEHEGNLALIEAIPDLLAACKASLKLPDLSIYAEESSSSHHHSARKAKEYYDKMNAVLNEIKAAIAKAEGATP